MKRLLIFMTMTAALTVFLSLVPPPRGLSQDTAKRLTVDTSIAAINAINDYAYKNRDSAQQLTKIVNSKLDYHKIVYRTKTIVKHIPVKVPIHDTIYITDIKTKYVPTVSKKEAQKLNRWYTDSLAKLNKKIDSLTPKKKKHKFLGL